MDLLGVKVHDVTAFAASKAFYGGVSMDQILQACHWKSKGPFLPFRILRGCLASDGSSLAQQTSTKEGGCMTTHPADGAGQNPDHIEQGFLPLKVNIYIYIYILNVSFLRYFLIIIINPGYSHLNLIILELLLIFC